jgi:hypothetical protein
LSTTLFETLENHGVGVFSCLVKGFLFGECQ